MKREEAESLHDLAKAARLGPGPEAVSWSERLMPRKDALRQAMDWFLEAGDTDAALELAAGVWRLWPQSGDVSGGRDMLARALAAAATRPPTRAFAQASYADGLLAFRQGQQTESQARNEATLAAASTIGDKSLQALAFVGLSRVALRSGAYERVCSLADEARALVAQAPEDERLMPLHMLAAGTRLLGKYDRARVLYLENLELSRRLEDTFMIAVELHNMGHVEIHRGDAGAARAYFRECSTLRDGSTAPYDLAMEHLNRAAVANCEGKSEEASECLTRAEATLAEAGIVLDPDDRFEVDWLRARLTT
ncbi:MAG TPA: hypothetical protein VEU09_00160 [Candidatus Binatia bacterium]|nr:hypothetical protein [Candidatus Binatia bacterium]